MSGIAKKCYSRLDGRRCQHCKACMYTKKLGLFFSVYVDDIKMTPKTQDLRHVWKSLQAENDIEEPTPIMNQGYLGSALREAKVNPQAVQSIAELFKRITTAEPTDEKDQTKEPPSLEKITAWSYDMQGHAEKIRREMLRTRKPNHVFSPAGGHTMH